MITSGVHEQMGLFSGCSRSRRHLPLRVGREPPEVFVSTSPTDMDVDLEEPRGAYLLKNYLVAVDTRFNYSLGRLGQKPAG